MLLLLQSAVPPLDATKSLRVQRSTSSIKCQRAAGNEGASGSRFTPAQVKPPQNVVLISVIRWRDDIFVRACECERACGA